MADSDLIWVANEGIRVSALVDSFKAQRLSSTPEQDILRALCKTTADPLEMVADKSPLVGPIAGAEVQRTQGGAEMAAINAVTLERIFTG